MGTPAVNQVQNRASSNTLHLSYWRTPSVSKSYRVSCVDNYSVRTSVHFCEVKIPQTLQQVGWTGGEISFVCTHLLDDSVLKGDYIITIVASKPSAFLHWLVWSGLSDTDKARAFQQFSKQEMQNHSQTSLQSNSSTPQSPAKRHSLHKKKDRRPHYHQVIRRLTMRWLILVRHITHVQSDATFLFFLGLSCY